MGEANDEAIHNLEKRKFHNRILKEVQNYRLLRKFFNFSCNDRVRNLQAIQSYRLPQSLTRLRNDKVENFRYAKLWICKRGRVVR